MFCRRCGAELPPGAAACPRCQEPVLLPGVPAGFTAPGLQPPAQPQSSTGMYAPPPAGQWPPQIQAGQPFPPAGEQFTPPPPIPPSAWLTNAGPTGSVPPLPPPPSRPLLETLFGPSPRPGIALVHTNGVQRRFLSRLQPTTAGNVWFGALVGGLLSLVVAFFLGIICSLLLGGVLDQAFASVAALLNLVPGSTSASGGQSISFYSNPLVLFAYAHRSTFILKLAASTGSTPINASVSITPPATLLLLIPALGLLFGGYFAASTDYTGRRLFSIMRGASVSVVYALLALLLSFVTSVDLGSASSTSATATLTITPDALSVFLNSLCCGLIFGALGGALRARALPTVATGPLNRRNIRLRAAWLGARFSLTVFFSICLALVLALYLLAQIGGPTLQTEGSVSVTNSQPSTCHIFLQQPATAPSSTLPSGLSSSGLSGPVWFLVDSPPLAGWVMSLSLGAPLQITGGGLGAVLNTSVGLVGADCGPGPKGALLYLLLIIPAIAFYLGGRRAARFAADSTASEATSTGLLLAGMAALGIVVIAFISSITFSVLSVSINFGPSLLWSFFATLLFGAIFGVPGAILARTGTPPQAGPLAYVAWPMGPGAAAPTGQAVPQPPYSMAVSSIRPGMPGTPPSTMPIGGMPAAGAVPGSDPFHEAPTRLSGPLDLHHASTMISSGMAPPQAPPASPGSADIWHAPTQAPGSGSISDALTQPSNPEGTPGPQPPNPPGPAGRQ